MKESLSTGRALKLDQYRSPVWDTSYHHIITLFLQKITSPRRLLTRYQPNINFQIIMFRLQTSTRILHLAKLIYRQSSDDKYRTNFSLEHCKESSNRSSKWNIPQTLALLSADEWWLLPKEWTASGKKS